MFSIIITIPFSLAIIFCIIKKYDKRAIALICISFLFSSATIVSEHIDNHYRERFYESAFKDISTEINNGNSQLVADAIDKVYAKGNTNKMFKGAQIRSNIERAKKAQNTDNTEEAR